MSTPYTWKRICGITWPENHANDVTASIVELREVAERQAAFINELRGKVAALEERLKGRT